MIRENLDVFRPVNRPLAVGNGRFALRTKMQDRIGLLRMDSAASWAESGKKAGDGVRTRDIQLGKLVLCQLSYARK